MAAPLEPGEAPLARLPAEHPAQAYAALPARELIRLVKDAGSQPAQAAAQPIFAAFYYRYYAYLHTVVSNTLRFIHDRSGIQEIVNDALVGFFRASAEFDLARAEDDAGCDRLIRSYLGRLAKWRAKKARAFQKSFGADTLDLPAIEKHLNEQMAGGVPAWWATQDEPAPSPQAERVSRWIDSLREVQRDVLQTYYLDDHSGRKSDKLPAGTARSLAAKHRVTTSAIRHMKRRLGEQMRENFKDL